MTDEIKVAGLRLRLGEYSSAVADAINKAKADRLVSRIWKHDHTLWNPDPTEIDNRLGWLDVADRMRAEIPALEEFTAKAKADGLTHALLLGMGGSSLAPELFSKVFGGSRLKLSVLDSTDPDAVRAKADEHDPKNTVYIVSSKSGGTIETSSFFKYFYNQALEKLGKEQAGSHFVAITDPGSGLAETGEQYGFRQVFLADPNIGGRYSALSHFGLVPAALIGVDLEKLIASALRMSELCKDENVEQNPGAMLGLAMGSLALGGRDKITFRLPDSAASFADWAEQLIAESTGKLGKGILPVAGEPLLDAADYGIDRVFVYAEKETIGDDPCIILEWKDKYDLGGQFFLWEFATAVAGYVLEINPFDQPNVESAKIQAKKLVDEYKKKGALSRGKIEPLSADALNKFLKKAKQGDYIALQAYAASTEDLNKALQTLRAKVTKHYRLATTLGYGPRFLHSTGQLHKGDAGNGLFIQFVTTTQQVVPIPNEAGSTESEIAFGILKVAQALGDAQALREARRRVISFEVGGDLTSAVNLLTSELEK